MNVFIPSRVYDAVTPASHTSEDKMYYLRKSYSPFILGGMILIAHQLPSTVVHRTLKSPMLSTSMNLTHGLSGARMTKFHPPTSLPSASPPAWSTATSSLHFMSSLGDAVLVSCSTSTFFTLVSFLRLNSFHQRRRHLVH